MLIIYHYKFILAIINKTRVTVTVFLIAFLALHGVNGEEVHLFFTGSLNGKLEGCTCSKDPAPGLARRHAVLESLRKKYPEAIWVDTGDNVSGYNAPWQMQTILEYYTSARYHALLWGDEEMNAFQKLPECLRKKPWKNTGGKIPLLDPGLSLVDASRYGQWEEYSAFVRQRRWVFIRKNNTRIYRPDIWQTMLLPILPFPEPFGRKSFPCYFIGCRMPGTKMILLSWYPIPVWRRIVVSQVPPEPRILSSLAMTRISLRSP